MSSVGRGYCTVSVKMCKVEMSKTIKELKHSEAILCMHVSAAFTQPGNLCDGEVKVGGRESPVF